MKIQNININYQNQYQAKYKKVQQNFGSLSGLGDLGKPISTAFFRDFPTLDFAANYIRKTFPQGTNILNYACSNGDEAISLAAMLSELNSQKIYKIIGLDIDPKAIRIAKKGIHIISDWDRDNFLQKEGAILTQKLQQKLLEFLTPTSEKIKENHIKSFAKKEYYQRNDNALAGILEFRPHTQGNIFDAASFEPEKPAGAILFRNALYHITQNESGSLTYNLDAIEKVANAVHKRLDKNGIFVIGDFFLEHLYNVRANLKKIPLTTNILRAHGGFKPIFTTKVESYEDIVPTAWQKI